MNLFDIRHKSIIVTGGSGFLGSKYIEYLRGQGARVFNWDLPGIDITNREQVEERFEKIYEEEMWVDVLINNAAIDFPPGSDGNDFERVWNVNVRGAINCIELLAPGMVRRDGGSIVNIGSIYGMVAPDHRIYDEGFKKPFSYGVTKSALLGVTKYFAGLWADKGVRVNTLTLGGVKKDQSEGFIKRYSDKVPMGRMANPDDCFGALHFLVSDASKYMTGANLIVDGGYTIW